MGGRYDPGMESAVLAARLLLAAVFATAAAGKLLDLGGSRRALADFGVPASLTRAGGVLLPLVEIAIAAALLFPSSARWAALATVVLLLAFVVGIATALAQDRTPDCHCFGQIHSAPAGKGTLARNGALALAASIVAWRGPGPSIDSWVAGRIGVELLVIAAVVALAPACTFGYRAWRDLKTVQRTRATAGAPRRGISMGSPAPRFGLPSACGGNLTLDSLRARGRPVVLVFAQPGCCPCRTLFPHLGRWQTTLAAQLTIAVVSHGAMAGHRPLCEEHGIADVMVGKGPDLFHAYRIPGTPAAVVVGPDGKIASATVTGDVMIETLVRMALRPAGARGEPWKQPSLSG
jgi:uncharacterized membrane protein YphA (DoxX/SURF4 family)